MLLRFDATNGGAKFSEIAEEVILLDIVEQPAEMNVQKAQYGKGPGTLVSSVERTALSVQLVYVIRTQDPVRRAEVQRMVTKWATSASSLEISTRPGQSLRAKVYNTPVQISALRWTDELTITFTAYELPYWVDANVQTLTCNTNQFVFTGMFAITTEDIDVPIPVSCMAQVRNTGDVLTDLLLQVGNSKIECKGLDIPHGNLFVIESSTGHDMSIKDTSTGASYLHTRTAESDDSLMADPYYRNVLYAKANVLCDLTFYWPRWWL